MSVKIYCFISSKLVSRSIKIYYLKYFINTTTPLKALKYDLFYGFMSV